MLLGMGSMAFSLIYCQIDLVRNLRSTTAELDKLSVPALLVYNVFCIASAIIDALVEAEQMRQGEFPVGLALQAIIYILWNGISILWVARRFAPAPASSLAQSGGASIQELPDLSLTEPGLLSPRETQIARLVSQGLSNKEIAAQLKLSEFTVRNQLHGMFQKTGAKSRLELVRKLAGESRRPT
jgi:DNA-binding NarL/FixJ family response regulator